MKIKKDSKNSNITVISIIILDVILMVLFLFFSDQIIKDFQSSTNISTIVISSFALAIPGTLIILIIIQFFVLFKNKFKPGNNFKKNIVFYFILTISLAFVPQAVISISFIKVATNNWLNKNVIEAVNIGFNFALEIEKQNRQQIKSLSKNPIFLKFIKESYFNNKVNFENVTSLNSLVYSIEYYDENALLLKRLGPETINIKNIDKSKEASFYPKKIINSKELLHYQFKTTISGKKIIILLTNLLPKDYTQKGTHLTTVKMALIDGAYQKKEITLGLYLYYMLFSIPILLLAILICFIFSDEIIKPIKDIEQAIRKVAHGNYSYRILSKKNNEFNILITSFNNMIKEIEKSRTKLKHTEQISTWQNIAKRLAHEIKNPLTPIKLIAQRILLKENKSTEESTIGKNMETIINEVTRMEQLLNEFRDFAQFPQLNPENISIKTTIEEAIDIYTSTYPKINFDLTDIEDIIIKIDKNQIIQVISNLTINSIQAVENEGTIKYSSEIVSKKGQKYCRVSIKDNGVGISKELIQNIFKPYFTTKYNGSGLGLAIVNKIIIDHKGKIWIESATNVGTTFYFEFPKEDL